MTQISEQKFQELYGSYKNRIYASAEKIVKDHQRAEDVTQDVFLRLMKQDYSKIESYVTEWLFLVCRNCSIKQYHKKNRYVLFENVEDVDSSFDESASASEGLMNKELSKVMIRLMKKLSKNQQTALKLRFFKDYSYSEIAKKMKIKSGNVGFMISDGLRRLKILLDKENHKKGLY